MQKKYEQLFKDLISSYYNGNFDEQIENIIKSNFSNKEEAINILSSLCGVDILNDNNYIYNLKKAITTHEVRKNIVKKVGNCIEPCSNTGCKCLSLCPFDAILINPLDNSKYINDTLCENCGLCVEQCESGNFIDSIEFMPVLDLIKNNKKVVAAVAPAISGQFGENVTLDMLREAFVKIGFSDMIEVAFAADMLTIKEAIEFDHHVHKKGDILITSCCCPMWVGMLKKVFSELVKDVSPSISPMIAAGRILKKLSPDTKVVFIGPCIAKKAEAKDKDLIGAIDYVLTFQELKSIFDAFNIAPETLKGIPSIEYASRGGRLYARTGGVSEAISDVVKELFPEKHKIFKAIQADGVVGCKEVLSKALNGELDANFIEGMGCVGGCVGGPKRLINKEDGCKAVENEAYNSPIKVPTHSFILDEILAKLGINSLEDFKDSEKIKILERNF
ncbi:[Fe-Fe] hydrogenase large subunit C-terminal domain-containing protein [Clostridium tarantellae]|uniref:Iron hydrogenase n=1 Tax=Clostridium tarantellae TaxID=39493 RepID=A0A6I1MLY7_9CLOT|nr:[Fe-Fe] hydrogenase large subunit C-terminal domain-containing protein [Clostridium tarantellae]MPQ43252.1 iron hydrogenase [Clostridium tarantellae]